MTASTTAIVVAYGISTIDLSWLPPGTPLVVVHNDDLLPEHVAPGAIHLRPGINVGFGAGVNLALSEVTTERVAVFNPDMALLPAHWDALITSEPNELVTIPIDDERGTPTIVTSGYPTPLSHLLAGYRVGRWLPRGSRIRALAARRSRATATNAPASDPHPDGTARPLAERWASGACISAATDRIRAVDGFDESFFLYFEDVDLCRRLATEFPDMVVRVAATPPAVHAVGGTAGPSAASTVEGHRLESARLYATRQPGWAWGAVAAALRLRQRRVPAPARGHVDVIILSLGRHQARGERRRVRSWTHVFRAAGASVEHISLLSDHRRRLPLPHAGELAQLARGDLVPEALAWNGTTAARAIAARTPHAVVAVTARAYRPGLPAETVVLDFVDRLSTSYSDRALASGRVTGRLAYRVLARAARRFEARPHGETVRVATGVADAAALDATYVPIVVDSVPSPAAGAAPDTDVVFVGNLAYPPNIAALEVLGAAWPDVQRRRPGTTALVAGATAPADVRQLIVEAGWELVENFADAAGIYRRARVSASPLPFASGMQIKVLDAAVHGVAQVVSAAALAGLPDGLPAVVATPQTLAAELVSLLDDDERRADLASRAQGWAHEHFSVERWGQWAVGILPASAW